MRKLTKDQPIGFIVEAPWIEIIGIKIIRIEIIGIETVGTGLSKF